MARRNWAARWHWPVRIGVFSDGPGAALRREIEKADALRRRHASLVDFAGSARVDLLLFTRVPTYEQARALRDRANGILIFAGSGAGSPEELDSLRRASAAGFVFRVDPAEGSPAEFIDGLLYHQSHNEPLGNVLSILSSKWARLVGSVVQSAMTDIVLSKVLGAVTRRVAAAEAPIAISEEAYSRFGFDRIALPGLTRERSGPGFVKDLNRAMKTGALPFDREADSATGTAAVGRAAEDAASGPAIRYPDVAVHRFADNARGERIDTNSTIASGH